MRVRPDIAMCALNDLPQREAWKPVPGFEIAYSVSNYGRVRREIGGPSTYPGRLLKPRPNSDGYYHYRLNYCGLDRQFAAHILVALVFIGPKPEGTEVNHIHPDKANNFYRNLEYKTHLENVQHAIAQGRRGEYPRGDNHPQAKLRDSEVIEIIGLKGVIAQRKLAAKYGVSRALIRHIHQGKVRKHLQKIKCE
jgi:hypothetical protein